MEPLKNTKPYPFIDFIRFISMIGIVWSHTDVFPSSLNIIKFSNTQTHILTYVAFKQLSKFSVISFFMISGFLLAGKLEERSEWTFLKKRLESIAVPYLVALSVYIGLLFITRLAFVHNYYKLSVLKEMFYAVFYSPYWYVPVYFMSLITILIFNRVSSGIWFGLVCLSVTCLYTFSENFQTKAHNTAFFAFVFYIWLGMFISKNGLADRIRKISIPLLTAIILVSFLLACLQSYELILKNDLFYTNNLRLYNQIYGIAFFLFLVRICPARPSYGMLNPRRETFGIDLYHTFVVVFLLRPIVEWMYDKGIYPQNNFALTLIIFIIQFLACYSITTLFVRLKGIVLESGISLGNKLERV